MKPASWGSPLGGGRSNAAIRTHGGERDHYCGPAKVRDSLDVGLRGARVIEYAETNCHTDGYRREDEAQKQGADQDKAVPPKRERAHGSTGAPPAVMPV